VSELRQIVSAEIRRHGPMTVARFMELSLYHPQHGYYSSGLRRTGWGGHFVTSPELDPAFGELWCGAFERIWDACRRPEGFEVVEIGPGEGAMAAAVLEAAGPSFSHALTYRLIEPFDALRRRQQDRLDGFRAARWSASLDELAPVDGCVFANEVLDNQPVHVLQRHNGETSELMVVERGGELALAPSPASAAARQWLEHGGTGPEEEGRIEAPLAAQRLVHAAARVVRRGAVVLVDYGMEAAALGARPEGTLVSYSSAGADDSFLHDPGSRDITSHVNWSAIRRRMEQCGLRPVGPLRQRDVLLRLGAGDADAGLEEEARQARGAAHVRALSRRQALAALLDPGGLGSLEVMAGARGPDLVSWA
jgi:SAM-dependent MidA family methyltransferase